MIEAIMLLGTGFLAACLLMLPLALLIHERAVRLTTRRCLAAEPMSTAEMQAGKDQLRAQFAMSIQRFQFALEEAKTNAAVQLCEIGKKTVEIQSLKIELCKATVLILDLQARERMRSSITRPMVKLLAYMSVRSRRRRSRQALSISALRQSEHRRWGAVRLGLGFVYPKQEPRS